MKSNMKLLGLKFEVSKERARLRYFYYNCLKVDIVGRRI